MANLPISGLTASASNLASTNVLPVVQTTGVGPVKMTGLQFAGGLLGSATFNGATVTTSQPVLNLSQTWNAGAVTFTGLKFNATDTASASGSLLLDLQVGGVSLTSVRKDGRLTAQDLFSGSGVYAPSVIQVTSSGGRFDIGGDVYLTRAAAATLRLGAADAAAPVAQTLQVQSVVAGTSNTAGTNFTINGSRGTGTGAGGSIIFQVAPAGSSGSSQNAYATALTIGSDQNFTFGSSFPILLSPNGPIQFSITGLSSFAIRSTTNRGVAVRNDGYYGFSQSGNPNDTTDVFLVRDAANTLALRNSTNAQTFRVYNTFTDASNNEYLTIDWSSTANQVTIGTVANGTGAVRSMNIKSNYQLNLFSAAGAGMFFSTNGTFRWHFDGANGHFLAYLDNAYDIGASGANRPRNVYVGSAITAGTNIYAGTTSYIGWNGRSAIRSTGDGNILFVNSAAADFSLLQFGGTTSSFPALKRSSASLICRLADDSANAAFEALSLKTGAPTGGTSGTWKVGVYNATAPSATGYVEVDIGGTLYKLLAST